MHDSLVNPEIKRMRWLFFLKERRVMFTHSLKAPRFGRASFVESGFDGKKKNNSDDTFTKKRALFQKC